MIQIYGHVATKAGIEIDEQGLQKLIHGIPLQTDLEIENGYVILKLKGRTLGLGLLINGLVRSQISHKELRLPLKKISSGSVL